MNNFSDYIVFVDESGDHGLNNLDQEYPIFVLVFCIFEKNAYIEQIVPALQRFKFKYWGHDGVILHESDIRKTMGDEYKILTNPQIRESFLKDLSVAIDQSPFHVIASVIKKDKLCIYPKPDNPYELSMLFCMERLMLWLTEHDELGKSISIMVESRGKVEDSELELAFRRALLLLK